MPNCDLVEKDGVWTCQVCGMSRPYPFIRKCRPIKKKTPEQQKRKQRARRHVSRNKLAGERPVGPGDRLHWLLKRFGIKYTEGCTCKAMQLQMNEWGPKGCREHMDKILDHMAKEAKRRNLPFLRSGAKILVRLAIRQSERKGVEAPKEVPVH